MTPTSPIIERVATARSDDRRPEEPSEESGSGGALRSFVAGVVTGAVLYVGYRLTRGFASRAIDRFDVDAEEPIDSLRDSTATIAGDAGPVPIGVPGLDDTDGEATTAGPGKPDATSGELGDPDEPTPVDSGIDPGRAGRPDSGSDRTIDGAAGDGSGPDAGGSDPDADGSDLGAGGEAADDGETDRRRTDRPDAELDELSTDEIQDEPAEPGELSVDEEIVEDVTGEDADEGDANEE